MNPWTIIGWGILGGIAMLVLLRISVALLRYAARTALYLRSRKVKPEEGQRWMQDGSVLTIGKRYPTHFVVMTNGGRGSHGSWGESDEDWARRVKNRKLYLLS